ncbi:MAG: hypothetical protein ABW123_28845, partial [Cystobacter sp.]
MLAWVLAFNMIGKVLLHWCRRIGVILPALTLSLWITGCATNSSGMRQPSGADLAARGEDTGSAGGFDELPADAFQELQEAGGLEEAARHPAGAALYLEQARSLLGQLARTPVTGRSFAPRRALAWLLSEVLSANERVEYPDLKWRAERFWPLVLLRPDGYLVIASTGAPLQRLGSPQLEEGEWRVGRLAVGDFYFSLGGVLYPVNQALRRLNVPPLGELGLKRDLLNAALDGAQDAFKEMAVALAESILHPIRTVEELGQLPTTVANLIAASPEYFARYGTMSVEDQVREAARISTHLMVLLGGTEASAGRMSRLEAKLPVLSLSTRGELVLSEGATAGGATVLPVGSP